MLSPAEPPWHAEIVPYNPVHQAVAVRIGYANIAPTAFDAASSGPAMAGAAVPLEQ